MTTLGTNARGDPCMYCLRKQGGKMVIGVGYGICADCSTARKQAYENPGEPPAGTEFVFEPTLWSLVMSDKVLEADEEDGRHWTREPTEEQWNMVQFDGTTLKLPHHWLWNATNADGSPKFYDIKEFAISKTAWKKGERWTLRRVVNTMRKFYGAHKGRMIRSLGDHVFVEGFSNDGELFLGS